MAEKLMKAKVLRDFWNEPNKDGTENRTRAGAVIDVTADVMIDGLEKGLLSRVKETE